MSDDGMTTQRFVKHGVFYRAKYLPTLIKRHAATGTLAEEHWLTGPEAAPVYAVPPLTRPHNVKLYDGEHGVTALTLSGRVNAPVYAQRFDGPSKVWTAADGAQTVQHWLSGPYGRGTYVRDYGGADTLCIRTSTGEEVLTVQGSERRPRVVIQDGACSLRRKKGIAQQFWLSGALSTPVQARSLDSLRYRHSNGEDGYAARYHHRRVWAQGTWRYAAITRGNDLPASMSDGTGRKFWIDGMIENGDMAAVYWRAGNAHNEESQTGLPLWRQGDYPHTQRESLLLPYPDRVADITRHALYQLTGTCYMNAVFNIVVCTPCLRSVVAVALSKPAEPGCAHKQLLLDILYDSVCGSKVPQRPARQSNVMAKLEGMLFGRNDTHIGHHAEVFSMWLLDMLGCPYFIFAIPSGRMPRKLVVAPRTVLVLVLARRMDGLPSELRAADGQTFQLMAANLLGHGHLVCALRDTTGAPNIILDSNGLIELVPWWPTVHSPKWSQAENVLAWYVATAVVRARPVRCMLSAPPVVRVVDDATCYAAIAAFNARERAIHL